MKDGPILGHNPDPTLRRGIVSGVRIPGREQGRQLDNPQGGGLPADQMLTGQGAVDAR